MPPLIPTLVVMVACVCAAVPASAQVRSATAGAPALKLASASGGRITGMVRDDAGRGIAGASVIALGDTLATARSDARGRFTIALPAGEYVLRATHDGYLSTYREPVRVRSSVHVERNITLVRLGPGADPEPILAALALGPSAQPSDAVDETPRPAHPHNASAWRLRRLTRTILRDGGMPTGAATGTPSFSGKGSLFDRVVFGSARAAASFITDTDFTGQVNFLTAGLRNDIDGWRPNSWPSGVALVTVGAPVGTHGDWHVRGAVTPGDLSSWVFNGQYASRDDRNHAFRLGMSMGVQGDLTPRGRRSPTGTETRSVGAVHADDRWRVTRYLEIDYGIRLDRYDYVETPNLVGPSVGARLAVLGGTVVTMAASQRAVAPGASEFLPPAGSGIWLPPERTFSTLVPGMAFRPERVRHYAVGIEQAIGDSARSIFARRFRQATTDQVATVFGLDRSRDVGHYYVAPAGDAEIDGWQFGVSGDLVRYVRGTLVYTASRAMWTASPGRALTWAVPSIARGSTERLHDVAVLVRADIPETSTGIRVGYRLSSAFARPRYESRTPTAGARFDVEIRQALPYQPIRGGRLEALVALSNLVSDPVAAASLYDEIFTVAPPLRLVCGIQVRF